MKLAIVHTTSYRYTAPIAESVVELRLRPMDGAGQRCLDFTLELTPSSKQRTYVDGYGNHVHYFNLVKPHTRMTITSRSTVETGLAPDAQGEDLVADFLRFRSPVNDVEGVRRLARAHPIPEPRTPEAIEQALEALTLTISRDFTYDRTITNVYSTVDEVLELRGGVCQDFAHLFVAVARSMGVPARYVSGYLHMQQGDRSATTASHAWAEAWVPDKGWLGFDATRPVRVSEHHVRLAVGRDYSDAAPTRGVYVGSARGAMTVRVRTRVI